MPSVELRGQDFRDLASVAFAADGARSPAIPALGCVEIVIRHGGVRFAATDKYRMALTECPAPTSGEGAGLVWLADLAELLAVVGKSDDVFELHVGDGSEVSVGRHGGPRHTVSSPTAKYPDVERAMPTGNPIAVPEVFANSRYLAEVIRLCPTGTGNSTEYTFRVVEADDKTAPRIATEGHSATGRVRWQYILMPLRRGDTNA